VGLRRIVPGLFDWQCPRLPEDLCFLRPDGFPWLASIAHEQDAYLVLNDEELTKLTSRVPTLQLEPAPELMASSFVPSWLRRSLK
jgi:hypothetical protein